MDQQSVDQLDIAQLNESDKAELRQFVANEGQRTRVRERKLPWPSSVVRETETDLLTSFAQLRDPRLDGYLLEEVRARLGEGWAAGQERAELPGKLRGPVPRRQFRDTEAFEQNATAMMDMALYDGWLRPVKIPGRSRMEGAVNLAWPRRLAITSCSTATPDDVRLRAIV
jgi:hypothetical protein